LRTGLVCRPSVGTAALAALLLAGCASDAGEHVADRIRAANATLVRDVIYRPANLLDPSEIIVHLRPGATEPQAEQLWCDVVAPAGTESHYSDVSVWNDSGTVLMGPGRHVPVRLASSASLVLSRTAPTTDACTSRTRMEVDAPAAKQLCCDA
jgi:hypothetical protein